MSALTVILLVVHILISLSLVLIILAQTSKGGGLDSNLGGTAANVFGSGASEMLKKSTKIVGTMFLVSCVFLAITVKNGKSSTDLDTTNNSAVKAATAVETATEAPATTDIPVETKNVDSEKK